MFTSSKYSFRQKSVFDLDFKNTIIYCDPPYVATAYRAKKIWDKEKEKILANSEEMVGTIKKNIVILSNSKRTMQIKD